MIARFDLQLTRLRTCLIMSAMVLIGDAFVAVLMNLVSMLLGSSAPDCRLSYLNEWLCICVEVRLL